MDIGSPGIYRSASRHSGDTYKSHAQPSTQARSGAASHGFTLAELLITVAILAVLAAAMIPNLNSGDAVRLEVAATEVRNALRFARGEAMRRGDDVLFDAESSPGRVKISDTACTSFGTPKVVYDPRTKLAFDVDISGGRYSSNVNLTPRFMAGGTPYGGVTFDANGSATNACQVTGMNGKGTPEAGSSVLLTLGALQATISLDPATGRISGP